MRLIDVHCHLESDEFEGILPDVIQGARDAGVVKMVTASITPAQWDTSERLARQYPEVEFALGIHPWYIQPEFEGDFETLKSAKQRGAVAIGEIGLDKRIDSPSLDIQRKFFLAQLRIAKELDLPVILHCRAAFDELHACVKTVGLSSHGGILHNYSGSAELASQLARLNFYFSIGGVLTYRNSRKKREVLHEIYPERFLLETDSPDIPPVEVKIRPNVPANIRYSLRAAAEILGESEEAIAGHTTENAARILRFGET